MKRFSILLLAIISVALLASCNNNTASKGSNENNDSTSKANETEVVNTELDAAFKKMWENVTLTNADAYFKTDVAEDFYTINADGIVQNKEQLLVDTERLRMLEILDFKFFDQIIKSYDDVGIINGRTQAFLDGAYVGEIFYTAIFIKQNETWKYKNWQGTWTKDSPTPPSFISKD